MTTRKAASKKAAPKKVLTPDLSAAVAPEHVGPDTIIEGFKDAPTPEYVAQEDPPGLAGSERAAGGDAQPAEESSGDAPAPAPEGYTEERTLYLYERVPLTGDEVVYVAPNGSVYPATITERYGTHSALDVPALAGTLSVIALESVPYNANGAGHSWHYPE